MTNTYSPKGASVVSTVTGAKYEGANTRYIIESTNNEDLYIGDFVKSNGLGSVDGVPICSKASAGDKIRGVVIGIEADLDYIDDTYRTEGVERYVTVDDAPYSLIKIQANGTVLESDIGNNANIILDGGDDITGLSKTQLNVETITSGSAQLKILGMVNDDQNQIGEYTQLLCIVKEHELVLGDEGENDSIILDPIISQLDFTTAEPASPTHGDRYINTVTGVSSETGQSVTAEYIYEWSGSEWDVTIPVAGQLVFDESITEYLVFNGTVWAGILSITKFIQLSDTFSAYTNPEAIIKENVAGDGIAESTTTISSGTNTFTIAEGTASLTPVAGNNTFTNLIVNNKLGVSTIENAADIDIIMPSASDRYVDITNTLAGNAGLKVNGVEIVDPNSEIPASVIEDKFLRNDGDDTTSGRLTANGLTTTNSSLNLNSQGIEDTNVTTPIKLGNSDNTSFNIDDKTIVGAFNDQLRLMNPAGWIFGGGISDNGDGTIDVDAGIGFIRTIQSAYSKMVYFEWSASTSVALTDNSENYVTINYNVGSPEVQITTFSTILSNELTAFEIGNVYRNGTSLQITESPHSAQIGRELQNRLYGTARFARDETQGGLEIGETGTRKLTMSAGRIWYKVYPIILNGLDTNTGDTFVYYYRDGGSGWTTQTSQTQWNNTQYDDDSGSLATMTGSYYSYADIYVAMDDTLHILYGQAEYDNEIDAAHADLSSSLPDEITNHVLFISRLVFQKSAGTAAEILNPFDQQFISGSVSNHASLSNLDYASAGHTGFLYQDGSLPLTSNWDAGSYQISNVSELTIGSASYAGQAGIRIRQNDNLSSGFVLGYTSSSSNDIEFYGYETGQDLKFYTETNLAVTIESGGDLTLANNLNITGTISAGAVLADGVTATTQAPGNNTTKVATTAFVTAAVATSDEWDEVMHNGNTFTVLDTENLSATINQNDITNNPAALVITNTGSGNDITIPNGSIKNGTFTATTFDDGTASLSGGILSAAAVLADGVTATTQAALDDSTKVSTTAYTDDAVDVDRQIKKEPSGFTAPEDVIVTYDSTARTITLTGTVNAYYRGTQVTALTSGWVSDAHPATLDKIYFLKYDGTSFSWSETIWDFYEIQIAIVNYGTSDKWCIRESHGVMQWQSHCELHSVIGTYKSSGGGLSGYVLASSTAADRRPDVEATVINDEDLQTTNPLLNNSLYTQMYLAGATPTNVFVIDAADIVPLSGNRPYWNEFTGGAWQQTLMTNNYYSSVWLVAVPMSADVESQKYRYVWVQGQSESALLSTQKSLSFNDVNTGQFTNLTPESIAISQIITKYQGGNWELEEVNVLTGTRASQVSSPQGNFLSSVSHDTTLTGSGTTTDVLGFDLTNANTWAATQTFPSAGIIVGASTPFSDAAGTLTLQNIDALDATTETTIETAIDTLANLTSIGSSTGIVYATAGTLSYISDLPDGTTATTQAPGDNTTKVATTAFVTAAASLHDTWDEVMHLGNTFTIANTENLSATINQNDVTNNPAALVITNTGSGNDITTPNGSIKNGTFTGTTFTDGTASLTGGILSSISEITSTGDMLLSPAGDLIIKDASGNQDVFLSAGGATNSAGLFITNNFADPGVTSAASLALRVKHGINEGQLAVGSESDYHIVFTTMANIGSNHDHGTATNPTMYFQSATDPASDNTEWMSVSYNLIESGKGDIVINPFANVDLNGNKLTGIADITSTSGTLGFNNDNLNGISALSMSSTFTNSSLNTANGIVQTDGSGVHSSSATINAGAILADGVTATTQAPGDNTTKVATTAFVEASTGTHDEYNEILAPSANSSIAFAGYTNTWTSTLDTGRFFTISNTDADLAGDTTLVTLQFADNGDANGIFLECLDDSGGTPDTIFKVYQSGGLGAIQVESLISTAGVGNLYFGGNGTIDGAGTLDIAPTGALTLASGSGTISCSNDDLDMGTGDIFVDDIISKSGALILSDDGGNSTITIENNDDIILVANGDINLQPKNTIVRLYPDSASESIQFYMTNDVASPETTANSSMLLRTEGSGGKSQCMLALGAEGGNHLVIGTIANRSKDYDHDVGTHPWLYCHSATDPDSDNTEWIGIQHNGTLGQIQTGVGDLQLDAAADIDCDSNDVKNVATLTATTLTDGTATLTSGDLTGLTDLTVDTININGDTINATVDLYIEADGHNVIFRDQAEGNMLVSVVGSVTNLAGLFLTNDEDDPGNASKASLGFYSSEDLVQNLVFLGDVTGNSVIFTNNANRTDDHDHGVQVNPTIFVHSDTDPGTSNTQWISLAHNKTDGVIATGFGDLILNPTSDVNCNDNNITNVGQIDCDIIISDGATLAIGDGTETIAINSSDWDISTTGVMTGIGDITSDGDLTCQDAFMVGGNLILGSNDFTGQATIRFLQDDFDTGEGWIVGPSSSSSRDFYIYGYPDSGGNGTFRIYTGGAEGLEINGSGAVSLLQATSTTTTESANCYIDASTGQIKRSTAVINTLPTFIRANVSTTFANMLLNSEASNNFPFWKVPADMTIDTFAFYSEQIIATYEIDIYVDEILVVNGSQATTVATYYSATFTSLGLTLSAGEHVRIQIKRTAGATTEEVVGWFEDIQYT